MCVCRTRARSAPSLAWTDGREVEGAVEVASCAQREVGGGDRGHEAVVERRVIRSAGGRGPSRARRASSWTRSLPGVEDAQDLDPGEMRLEQSPGTRRRVLAQVPWVVGLLGARRREREPVRGRDVGDRRGPGSRASSARARRCARSSAGRRSRRTAPRSPRPARARSAGWGAGSAAWRARAPRGSRRRRPRRPPCARDRPIRSPRRRRGRPLEARARARRSTRRRRGGRRNQ